MHSVLHYGFDPGSKFGWSVFTPHGERLDSGVWLTHDEEAHPGWRFENARRELIALFTNWPTTNGLIVYEDVHVSVFRDKNNLRVYTGLVACMYQAAAIAGHEDIRGVAPSSLKKYATGSGSASKALMVDRCIKKFGHAPDTDDESDAIWAGHLHTDEEWIPPPLPPKQKSSSSSKKKTPRTRSARGSDASKGGRSRKKAKS